MDTSAMYKEQLIRDYIMKINFKGNFSVKTIKEDLKRIIRETPGVDLKWKKEEILTEVNGTPKIYESVKSVTIAITDGENSEGIPKVHSFTYFI